MSQWNISALDSPRVFFLRDGNSLADVGEKISRLAADDFRVASSFAFLSNTPIAFDAIAATPVLRYASGKPVVLLTRGESFVINADLVASEGLSQLESEVVVPGVRQADLLQLLYDDAGACVFEPHGNYHFVTPSLTHTARFIRIGDLLHDLETLDRLAFWLRPYVGSASAVLTDSWSIASAILRTLQINRLNIPFDCLPEHPTHNSIGCGRIVEGLLSQIVAPGKLVAFVSISGSGKLVEQLVTMINERRADSMEFECVSFYGFANTPDTINCFARVPARESFHPDSCELCDKGSVPIHIDPAAYHLKSLHESLVCLSKAHAKPAKPFIETYRDTPGLFVVHHDDRNDGRHHAFDLDMLTLMSHPEFQKRLAEKFKTLEGKVDLVVAPNHEPGKVLADETAKRFHCPVVIHDTLERARMTSAEASIVVNATKLLIVDDVVNSGSRLKRYIQSLREGHFGQFEMLNCLVALARPASPQNLAALSKSLIAGHDWKGELYSVEQIILPSWSKDQCPWCAEFDFLSRIARQFSRPPEWLSERLAKLRNRTNGIRDEPLLLLPGITSVTLGDQSPLCSAGTPSTATTFLLASALQLHRFDSDLKKQLHPGFPVGNVMSPENVKDRYTEGLIRAILLRLVQRAEWGQTAAIETRDFLLTEMAQSNQQIIAGELLFAFGRATMPPISPAKFESAFSEFFQDDLDVIESVFFKT